MFTVPADYFYCCNISAVNFQRLIMDKNEDPVVRLIEIMRLKKETIEFELISESCPVDSRGLRSRFPVYMYQVTNAETIG